MLLLTFYCAHALWKMVLWSCIRRGLNRKQKAHLAGIIVKTLDEGTILEETGLRGPAGKIEAPRAAVEVLPVTC